MNLNNKVGVAIYKAGSKLLYMVPERTQTRYHVDMRLLWVVLLAANNELKSFAWAHLVDDMRAFKGKSVTTHIYPTSPILREDLGYYIWYQIGPKPTTMRMCGNCGLWADNEPKSFVWPQLVEDVKALTGKSGRTHTSHIPHFGGGPGLLQVLPNSWNPQPKHDGFITQKANHGDPVFWVAQTQTFF